MSLFGCATHGCAATKVASAAMASRGRRIAVSPSRLREPDDGVSATLRVNNRGWASASRVPRGVLECVRVGSLGVAVTFVSRPFEVLAKELHYRVTPFTMGVSAHMMQFAKVTSRVHARLLGSDLGSRGN